MNNRRKENLRNNHGYALVELLFYMSVLAILILVVINAMIVMSRAFRETTIQAELMQGGAMMERLSREVRASKSITSISNTDLVLSTTDQAGVAKSEEFVLSGSNINFLENAVSTGNLNPASLAVSGLSFTKIITAKGTAVKVSFNVQSVHDNTNKVVGFYNTVVLRGDY